MLKNHFRKNIAEQKQVISKLLYGNTNILNNAKYTICITVYKRTNFIKEAIRSALDQNTTIIYKVIVVDDNPNIFDSEILEIVKTFNDNKLYYYKNETNLGMMGNWNRCAILADTEYFSFLHDDDLLKPNFIEILNKQTIKYKKCDAFSFGLEQLNNPFVQQSIQPKTKNSILKKLFKILSPKTTRLPIASNLFLDNVYGPPTCGMTFKRKSFLQTGGYDQIFWPTDDWIFMLSFSSLFKVKKVKSIVGVYRWAQNESLKEETLEMFKIHRALIIDYLRHENTFCRFLYFILKKDFEKRKTIRIEVVQKYSRLFTLIQKIYLIRIK